MLAIARAAGDDGGQAVERGENGPDGESDLSYSYDREGRMVSTTYPTTADQGTFQAWMPRETVRILRQNGIETTESCEETRGHSYPEPTVCFDGSH
jgi:hypothetical protein